MQTIWRGRSAWISMLTMKNIILGLLTGGIWLVVPVIKILSSEYHLTDQQLLTSKGTISKREDQLDLVRIKDVRLIQSGMGRILNFGDLILITSDKSHPELVIKSIQDPGALRSKIHAAAEKKKENHGVKYQEWL